MSRAVRWAGASAGSLGLHGGALALLLGAFHPDPPGAQTPLPAAFEVVAASVRNETATALPAEAEAVASADPVAIPTEGSVIPTNSGRAIPLPALAMLGRVPDGVAPAAAPPPRVLASETPNAGRLRPSAPTGAVITPSDPPSALASLRPALVEPGRLESAKLETAQLAASSALEAPVFRPDVAPSVAVAATAPAPVAAEQHRLEPETVAAEIAPVGARAPAAPAAALDLAPAPPGDLAEALQRGEGVKADLGLPAGPPAAALSLPATAVVAALGWTGDAATIDSKSVAAVGAFLSPVSAGESSEVRDRVTSALAAVDCARLQTAFDPERGALELRGNIPSDDMRSTVIAALHAEIGGAIPVVDRLHILPNPQCRLLGLIEAVGLPPSEEQGLDPRIIGPDTHVREYRYAKGDRLVLDVVSPSYPAIVYVDYFDASGMVVHLQPNTTIPATVVPPDTALSVGAERSSQPSLAITVGPPYGQEIAVALAVSHPLYEGTRPLAEPAEEYLPFLRERVAKARADHVDFKGEWVYFFVSTRDQW